MVTSKVFDQLECCKQMVGDEEETNERFQLEILIFNTILATSFFIILIGSIFRLTSVILYERRKRKPEDVVPHREENENESFIQRVMVKQQYLILLFFFMGFISIGRVLFFILDTIIQFVPSLIEAEYFILVLSIIPGNFYSILYLTVLLSWAETYYQLVHYTAERDRLREFERVEQIGQSTLIIHKISSELNESDEKAILRLKLFYIFMVVLLSILCIIDAIVVISIQRNWLHESAFFYIYVECTHSVLLITRLTVLVIFIHYAVKLRRLTGQLIANNFMIFNQLKERSQGKQTNRVVNKIIGVTLLFLFVLVAKIGIDIYQLEHYISNHISGLDELILEGITL
jgi:hypothetical protein